MKKIGIAIFAVALVIGLVVANMFSLGKSSGNVFNFSMNFRGVRGSRNIENESRSLSGFKGLDVSGVFQVEFVVQKEFSVEIEADDNLLPLIRTEVRDGVLRIESEKRLRPSTPVRIKITAPDIDNIELSGAANVTVEGLNNPGLTLDSSGASKIKLSGNTALFNVDVSGATKIDAENLRAVDANIEASGSSSVTVNVTGELRTEASGASKIVYSGSPTSIQKSTHGASHVSQKDG